MTVVLAWLVLAIAGFAGLVATFVGATQRYSKRFDREHEDS